ncbi:FKBP-type peptidyl-prolyl cis-trans isomerase [Arthrospiribacter ruber]|uniref:FKBP-type peptidyl-prolyl cis-trans isomerase n=1 Tax=Arthrospiribacter ruber TaxID=2487934 RepID=UPI001FEA33B3|nr:FKBP-type peptidyl-prolyl cis-trans isomerase [Arthrospiribacter ruber]
MRILNRIVLGMMVLIFAASCDQQPFNPFGPTYDVDANLERERPIIEEFIRTYEVDSVARIHDRNGVVIIVHEEGDGARPQSLSLVYCNYVAKLLDGTIVDTNLEDVALANDVWADNRLYRIFQFTVDGGDAIQGFSIGFRNLRSGSKATLIIPSVWAYRDQEQPNIPEDSIMIFEVEFLGMD